MLNETFVCVDLETTGLSYADNEIIEIGAVKIKNGQIIDTFSTLVKPQKEVQKFISNLTGISIEMLQSAPAFEKVFSQFLEFLGDGYFVAHNAIFDYEMLNQELRRLDLPKINNIMIDTQELAIILYPDAYSHKLSSLAKEFNFSLSWHRALNDAEFMAHLFLRMWKDLDKLNLVVIKEALRLLSHDKEGLKLILQDKFKKNFNGKSLDYTDYLKSYTPRRKAKKAQNMEVLNQDIPEFFRARSTLRQNFSDFEIRKNQQDMSEFIADCFTKNSHGVVEAGTGTGKSLAYLLPAIFQATKHNTPVIISTKTKNLQTQLLLKDIPKTLVENMPNFTYALIKGKENYIDIERFHDLYKKYAAGEIHSEKLEFIGLLSWLLKTESGDLGELHPNIYNRFYYKVKFNVFSNNNFNKKSKEKCFINKIRKIAKEVDIIITNHALVFADMANGGSILPKYDYIIFDEAHGLEDSATNSFSVEFTQYIFKDILDYFEPGNIKGFFSKTRQIFAVGSDDEDVKVILVSLKEYTQKLKRNTQKILKKITEFFEKNVQPHHKNDKTQLLLEANLRANKGWEKILSDYKNLSENLCQIKHFLDKLMPQIAKINFEEISLFNYKLACISNYIEDTLTNLDLVFLENPNSVVWLEAEKYRGTYVCKLISAPLKCDQILAEKLFSTKKSIICASATLTINKSFDYFINRIGLKKTEHPFETLYLVSEFDYKNQAKFVALKDLPEFDELKDAYTQIGQISAEIIKLFQGQTLFLFRSYKTLKQVYYVLKQLLRDQAFQLYCQGIHGSPENIIERFRKLPQKAVLLGVDSFWEGIDIPGDNLKCVVMQKLPFAVPSEPLHFARSKYIEEQEQKSSFFNYLLPLAILKFKQGIGRLIRTKNDTGFLFVLDNRLYSKSYGKRFRNEFSEWDNLEIALKDIDKLEQNINFNSKVKLRNSAYVL